MTLRARLTLGFLAVAVLLVTPLAIALRSLQEVSEITEQLSEGEFSASVELGQARQTLLDLRSVERVFPFFPDSVTTPRLAEALGRVSANADTLEAFGLEGAVLELRRMVDSITAVLPVMRAAIEVDDSAAVDSASNRMVLAIDRAEVALERAGGELEGRSSAQASRAALQASGAFELARWALILAVLAGTGVAVAITRSISRPVRELELGMRAVADGDFTRPIRIERGRDDEFGRLATSYQRMARQLTELDKLKAEFVSIASHELRTPINVILGYLQLLEEDVYGPLNARQKEVLATLSSQGQSLARLVQQLLDISRFEAGGGKLDLRDVELEQFAAELENAFRVLAHQRGVLFQVQLDDALPASVRWDPDRMNEVVGNLLSNAFKFTGRGGRVELELAAAAGNVQIQVRDTGAGIAPAHIPHIFRKFYQADNQSAAALKGTGLGLAIAKEIVEAHGGSIGVESTVGVGTTFTLALPPVVEPRRGTPAAVVLEPESVS